MTIEELQQVEKKREIFKIYEDICSGFNDKIKSISFQQKKEILVTYTIKYYNFNI